MFSLLASLLQGLSDWLKRDGGFEQEGDQPVISIEGAGDLPAVARGAIVTVGNFDGVHRGHQRLLARLRAKADRAGVPAMAITFDPHPVALLRPEAAPVPLVWLDREIAPAREAGASLVGVFRTGPVASGAFCTRILRPDHPRAA